LSANRYGPTQTQPRCCSGDQGKPADHLRRNASLHTYIVDKLHHFRASARLFSVSQRLADAGLEPPGPKIYSPLLSSPPHPIPQGAEILAAYHQELDRFRIGVGNIKRLQALEEQLLELVRLSQSFANFMYAHCTKLMDGGLKDVWIAAVDSGTDLSDAHSMVGSVHFGGEVDSAESVVDGH
jgi:hypothetical protein